MFYRRKIDDTTLIFRLCDRLYRIEEEDLQKLMEEVFLCALNRRRA